MADWRSRNRADNSSHCDSSWSTLATMRFCSANGGTRSVIDAMWPWLTVQIPDVVFAGRSIRVRISGEFHAIMRSTDRGADSLQQLRRRFVVLVLLNQLASHGQSPESTHAASPLLPALRQTSQDCRRTSAMRSYWKGGQLGGRGGTHADSPPGVSNGPSTRRHSSSARMR